MTAPPYETLQVHEASGVLHVTLNRPVTRNAMSLRMVDELLAVLAQAERGGDDGFDAQVRLTDGRRADAGGDVGERHVQRSGIGVAVDGHGAIAAGARATNDAAGDLAAIGDEHGAK